MDMELIKLEEVNAAEAFTPNGLDPLIGKIKEEIAKFVPDLTTSKGRKEIASMASKVSKSKTFLEGKADDLTADWKEKTGIVNTEKKRMKNELDKLRDSVRKPLTDWQNKEKDRKAVHEDDLELIKAFALISSSLPSVEVDENLQELISKWQSKEDSGWEEYQETATIFYTTSLDAVKTALDVAIKREEAERELAQLRKEKAERKAEEELARVKREAAEEARREAEEAKLEVEAEANRERVRIAEQAREAEESRKKLEREKIEAEQEAARLKIEQERALLEAERKELEHAKALEQQKIEADKQAKINAEREQKRKQAERLKAEEARRAQEGHCARVRELACTSIMKHSGIGASEAIKIVQAIELGKVEYVKLMI